MNYNLLEYRNRVLGCFLGKNAGGTLGMKDEWHRRVNNVTTYVHEITGEPLPNDDIDLQLVWLIAMEEQGVKLTPRILGDYWMLYITPHWAEYGKCKINMRFGIMPPFSGTVNNPYKDSCGAYIRSEIWACVAPGCPDIAVKYAYMDALVDHGEGEGLYGEMFCAAMQSSAFVEKDIRKLIKIGLSYIPKDCAVALAIGLVEELYDNGASWQDARDKVLSLFLGGFIFTISPEDEAKGFIDGKIGWEAPSNVAFVVLALLYGEGDFGTTICTAVNCGEDTDCTAATAGATLGILLGINDIPDEWGLPIGTNLKPACLNLGELGNLGNLLPKDIFELQSRIEKLAHQVLNLHSSNIALVTGPTSIAKTFEAKDHQIFYFGANTVCFEFDFLAVEVEYEGGIEISLNSCKKVNLTLKNRYKTAEGYKIHIYSEDAAVLPTSNSTIHLPEGIWFKNTSETVSFVFKFNEIKQPLIRAVAELTTPSRAGVILVPIQFFHNGICDQLYIEEGQ